MPACALFPSLDISWHCLVAILHSSAMIFLTAAQNTKHSRVLVRQLRQAFLPNPPATTHSIMGEGQSTDDKKAEGVSV